MMIHDRHRPWAVALAAVALASPAVAAGDQAERSARLVGVVRDAAGEPIEGVVVRANRLSDAPLAPGPFPSAETGKDGSFELIVRFLGDRPIVLREVWAERKGYVRADLVEAITLKDGGTERREIRLEAGEVLAGEIRIPTSGLEARAGLKPADQAHLFFVRGGPLQKLYATDKGGRFEVYLPSGEYTLQCLTGGGLTRLEWKGLKTGRRDLLLEPAPFAYNDAQIGPLFDRLWTAMDLGYSYFFLKPDVDWAALKDRYRPQAVRAKDARELTATLREMLAHLKDMHVWIETPGGIVATHGNPYRRNFNRARVLSRLEDTVDCGFAVVGKARGDAFGYFLMTNQGGATPEGVAKAVAAIEALRDAPGFVVDLRQANGGDERMAAAIAGLFCDRDTVYARSKVRAGPDHAAFTADRPRVLRASPRPYAGPVVCLIGPGAVSSGEGFVKMMKALPRVTTVGLPTRGASGNPGPVALDGTGLSVWFSRWVDMMPDGTSFEGVGIAPDVIVDLPPDAYVDGDPTLDRGLELLREKVAGAGKAGDRPIAR
jgi:carboxyl-terminal processing protease